jgi:hypothetical protein
MQLNIGQHINAKKCVILEKIVIFIQVKNKPRNDFKCLCVYSQVVRHGRKHFMCEIEEEDTKTAVIQQRNKKKTEEL